LCEKPIGKIKFSPDYQEKFPLWARYDNIIIGNLRGPGSQAIKNSYYYSGAQKRVEN
jgi:hypothetical protein